MNRPSGCIKSRNCAANQVSMPYVGQKTGLRLNAAAPSDVTQNFVPQLWNSLSRDRRCSHAR